MRSHKFFHAQVIVHQQTLEHKCVKGLQHEYIHPPLIVILTDTR